MNLIIVFLDVTDITLIFYHEAEPASPAFQKVLYPSIYGNDQQS